MEVDKADIGRVHPALRSKLKAAMAEYLWVDALASRFFGNPIEKTLFKQGRYNHDDDAEAIAEKVCSLLPHNTLDILACFEEARTSAISGNPSLSRWTVDNAEPRKTALAMFHIVNAMAQPVYTETWMDGTLQLASIHEPAWKNDLLTELWTEVDCPEGVHATDAVNKKDFWKDSRTQQHTGGYKSLRDILGDGCFDLATEVDMTALDRQLAQTVMGDESLGALSGRSC